VSKRHKKGDAEPAGKKGSDRPAGGRAVSRPAAPRKGGSPSLFGWMYAKRPVLAFVVLFIVLLGVFYWITFIEAVNKKAIPAYMRFNARASVAILNVFGEKATAQDTSVTSKRFSVNIQHGCDAIEPSALFLAAVLAFPASLKSKLPGLFIGTLVLAIVNLVRIVTLFYTGIFYPKWFEIMHVDVWQPIFIILSLTFWIIWAWWATRAAPSQT